MAVVLFGAFYVVRPRGCTHPENVIALLPCEAPQIDRRDGARCSRISPVRVAKFAGFAQTIPERNLFHVLRGQVGDRRLRFNDEVQIAVERLRGVLGSM